MKKFEDETQKIVNMIKKNPPKVEKPDYNKIVQPEKEEDDDDADDSFNPDDWDTFDFDDDDED